MTWKRCAGCTRAIAATAFSCEYCGEVCDDVREFLPVDDERPEALPFVEIDPRGHSDAPLFDDAGPSLFPSELETADSAYDSESPWFPNEPEQAAVPREPATPAAGDFDDAVAHLPFASRSLPADPGSQAPVTPGSDAGHYSIASEPAVAAADYDLDFLDGDHAAPDDQQSSMPIETPAPPASVSSHAVEQSAPSNSRMGTRQLAMVGGGVLAAVALIFTILGMRGAASPEPAAAPAPGRRAPAKTTAAPKSTPPAAVKTVAPAADAPRWSRVSDGRWVSTHGQTAAFELPATGRVHVWTRDVTPVLVVRCEKGNAEAFVYTQSAAQMEPQDGDHTVQVAFDGANPATERWPDSAEHDALFARHPLEFTRQLTQSQTLQFGFTPHNAEPAHATFVLDGLEPLLAASAKQCGWKP